MIRVQVRVGNDSEVNCMALRCRESTVDKRPCLCVPRHQRRHMLTAQKVGLLIIIANDINTL